jgi:DNA-binding XRE family transcriptional regulator
METRCRSCRRGSAALSGLRVEPAGQPVADLVDAGQSHGPVELLWCRGRLRRPKTAGLTQAEVAEALGVSQTRVSKIEHGDVSGIDVIRSYVAALGGTIEIVASIGDRTWRVA